MASSRTTRDESVVESGGGPHVIERELMVANRLGLHARASARLVQLLSGYRCNVTLAAKGREVNAKSIMGVMLLAAGPGTAVVLRADGVDETAAAAAVADLFERNFDEES
jgi:phosphocarrier protein HPr